jgi:hypothetical protein
MMPTILIHIAYAVAQLAKHHLGDDIARRACRVQRAAALIETGGGSPGIGTGSNREP